MLVRILPAVHSVCRIQTSFHIAAFKTRTLAQWKRALWVPRRTGALLVAVLMECIHNSWPTIKYLQGSLSQRARRDGPRIRTASVLRYEVLLLRLRLMGGGKTGLGNGFDALDGWIDTWLDKVVMNVGCGARARERSLEAANEMQAQAKRLGRSAKRQNIRSKERSILFSGVKRRRTSGRRSLSASMTR